MSGPSCVVKDFIPLRASWCYFCSWGLSQVNSCIVHVGFLPQLLPVLWQFREKSLGSSHWACTAAYSLLPPRGWWWGFRVPLYHADAVLTVNIAIALWSLCMYVYVSYSVVSILCGPLDYSLQGSSVHGIFQARRLEWITISSSRGSSQPRNQICISRVSCTLGWFFYPLSHQGSLWSLVTWKPKQCSWLGSHNTLWEEFLWFLSVAALQYTFVWPGQDTRS